MDPEISQQLHEQVFETYNSLKSLLPKQLLKIQVLKNQRYSINKPTIMKEIEKDIINKNKNFLSSSQKINIFYNENQLLRTKKITVLKRKNEKRKSNISEINKYMNKNRKQNISLQNNEIHTFKDFREKNMKLLGVKCDIKLKRSRGMYNSFSVSDVDMKKNIYLPKIIDRMKYNVPRNLRNNQGLIIIGKNIKDIVEKNKDPYFEKINKDMPTDLFFFKLEKINKMLNKNKKDNNNSKNTNTKTNYNDSQKTQNKSENSKSENYK
jgi:hypothetical protein